MTEQRGPLAGITVIELAQWVFVPSAAAILADHGADVLRIEHPRHGDPYAALTTSGTPNTDRAMSARSAQANRGKRSIGIDLARPEGRELALSLVRGADVFMTSFRADALKRLGMTRDELTAINPRLVYARGDAFGPDGPDSHKPGYDITAFWARGGVGSMVTPPGASELARQPPSFGDRISAVGLAAGVMVSLLGRERSGVAEPVSASLLATATWVAASEIVSETPETAGPLPSLPPLTGPYRCADGGFVMINLMQSERYWDEFCKHLGAPELATDPRFADLAARQAHPEALRAELARLFARRTRDEWAAALATFEGPWAPVREVREVAEDPQVAINGFVRAVADGDGMRLVPSPFTVGKAEPALPRGPELGEHTEQVLLEAGCDWAEIERLKTAGVVT